MILIDTNVVIDAFDSKAGAHRWALDQMADAVSGEGAVVNAVILAELCAGAREGVSVEAELKRFGVQVADLPAAVASVCGRAYRRYRAARAASGSSSGPAMPLPDFFIGAHASVMGWKVATRDAERFRRYFPSVELLTFS